MPENEKAAAALLTSYPCIVAEIQRLQQEIEGWRCLAEELTPIFSAGPSMVPIEQIDKLCAWLASKIRDNAKRLIQIEQIIKRMEDERFRRLLWFRYIDGMTWEAIADEMDMSSQWVQKLHQKALRQIMVEKRGIE